MASVQQSMSPEPAQRRGQGVAALLALAAVLYLTLLPFEFHPMALADTWAIYTNQTFALPDEGARQQWIANILMFVPLGFFFALWLVSGSTSIVARLLAVGLISLVSLLVTASVEFMQVWMPYRSASIVDISGNFTGGVLGSIAGAFAGQRLWRSGVAVLTGERRLSRDRLLLAYCMLYVFASLFPFDFPLSPGEVLARFTDGGWGLWVAPESCDGRMRCLALMALKPLFAVPVGVWLAARLSAPEAGGKATAVLAAIALALALEFMQFLIYSGVAEGRSALLRAAGLVGGVVWADRLSADTLRGLRERLGPAIALVLAIPYCVVVVGLVTGFSGYHWDTARAIEQLQTLSFLPFYYHYFVSEAVAARSLIYQAVAYAPVGGLVWLASGGTGMSRRSRGRGAWIAAGLALVLALVAESLKLFAVEVRPDPTSLLIAVVAAVLVYRGCVSFFEPPGPCERSAHQPQDPMALDSSEEPVTQEVQGAAVGGTASSGSAVPPDVGPGRPAWGLRGSGLILWVVVLGSAAMWPVWAPWLVVGLVAYGVALYFRPAACLLVLPAAVPVLDWSMLTGFEAVDEFDLLALASVGSLLLAARTGAGMPRLPAGLGVLLTLFTVSVLASSFLALNETFGLSEQGGTAYLSEYNILRATKGFALALVLFLLIPQSGVRPGVAFRQYLVPGMALGLFVASAVVVWERAAYPGLLDFDSQYRISGMFTEMRVGGPSIEAFLVLTLPFALLWLWLRPSFLRALIVMALLAGGLYGVFVTYSRAGYLGVGVSAVVITVLGLVALLRGHGRGALAGVVGVLLIAAVAGVLTVQHTDGFATQRLGQIEADLERRVAHWEHTLGLGRPGLVYATLGHGPGMYPREYRLNSPPDELPANFAFRADGDEGQLLLGTGQSLFINQRVPWFSGDTLELEVSGHSDSEARLQFFLCQKHVRYSFSCETEHVEFPAKAGETQSGNVTLSTGRLGQPEGVPPRHLTIAVRNATRGSVVTLHTLQLRDQAGAELLRNTDFSAGEQHWYFTTDELWPWRVENQWLEVYFEQGWFGLVVFVLLTGVTFLYMVREAVRGHFSSALVLGSLLGVLTNGIFSTVFFSPRLMLLFYLTLFLSLAATPRWQPLPLRIRRNFGG